MTNKELVLKLKRELEKEMNVRSGPEQADDPDFHDLEASDGGFQKHLNLSFLRKDRSREFKELSYELYRLLPQAFRGCRRNALIEDDRVEIKEIETNEYWEQITHFGAGLFWADRVAECKQNGECLHDKISKNALAVAMIVENKQLELGINAEQLQLKAKFKTNHKGSGKVTCTNQRFENQPSFRGCSAFLVAPDIIATAGHCFYHIETGKPKSDQEMKDLRVIFGYELNVQDRVDISPQNVFSISDLLIEPKFNSSEDWALVRLDREVENIDPVKFPDLALDLNILYAKAKHIYMIGHPLGLPKKFTPSGLICGYGDRNLCFAEIDGFSGNSGSMICDGDSHEVIGIFVGGEKDFEEYPQSKCMTPTVYHFGSTPCQDGEHEIFQKIQPILHHLKQSKND